MTLDTMPDDVGDDTDKRPAENQHSAYEGQRGKEKQSYMRPLNIHVDIVQRIGIDQKIKRKKGQNTDPGIKLGKSTVMKAINGMFRPYVM